MSISASPVTIRVCMRTGGSLVRATNQTDLSLSFPATATIRDIREQIAQRASIPAMDLCLVWQGRMLKDLAKQVCEVKIHNNDQVIAVRKSQSAGQPHTSLHSSVYGTLTCTGRSPMEISQVVSNLANVFATDTSEPTSDQQRWQKGLANIRFLQGLPPELTKDTANSYASLGLALKQCCALLDLTATGLSSLSDSLLAGKDSTDEAKKIAPNCNKASAMLGLAGATLADFAHSTQTSSMCNVKMHTISIDDPMPQACTKYTLYRHLFFTVLDAAGVVNNLKEHEHATFIYSYAELASTLVIEFIVSGLRQNTAILLIQSPTKIKNTLALLDLAEVDTKLVLETKRLCTLDNEYFHQKTCEADLLDFTSINCREALINSSCNKLFVIQEVLPFAAPPPLEAAADFQDKIIEYERNLSTSLYANLPCTGICLYDRKSFPSAFISALKQHTIFLVDEQ